MGRPLPHKLVELLREMRAKGVSLAGLREATGLNQKTLIRYTSDVPRAALCACGRRADHGGGCIERRKGYSPEAVIRANIGDFTRKWNDEADNFLLEWYPKGMSLEEIAEQVNKILGRTDITPHAVQVRAGTRGLTRNPGARNNKAIAAARRQYWERWRQGKVTNNQRCPPPKITQQTCG